MMFTTFLLKTFCDSRDVPDGGRVSQFVCIVLLVTMVLTGLIGKVFFHLDCWAPAYIFITVAGIACGQSIGAAIENYGKNRADADALIAKAEAAGRAAAGPTTVVEDAENVNAAP